MMYCKIIKYTSHIPYIKFTGIKTKELPHAQLPLHSLPGTGGGRKLRFTQSGPEQIFYVLMLTHDPYLLSFHSP